PHDRPRRRGERARLRPDRRRRAPGGDRRPLPPALMNGRHALAVSALGAMGALTWWLLSASGGSPLTVSVRAIPPRSAAVCHVPVPNWPYACRRSAGWYHLDLHAKGHRPVFVECTAVLLDARGRPIKGSLGDPRWRILVDPTGGFPGGLAREVDP